MDPGLDRLAGDLGVELDSPPRRRLKAKGLQACRAARERHRSVGRAEFVAVPLEALKARGQPRHQRVAGRLGRDPGFRPADLGLDRSPGAPAGDLRRELRAEADPEQRRGAVEQSSQCLLLAVKPAVLGLLIDVHRSTEYEHGAEPVERWPRFLGGDPLAQLEAPLSRRIREDAAAGVSFVNVSPFGTTRVKREVSELLA